MVAPVNPEFNKACVFIASQIFPLGFDVRHNAPNSMEELNESMNSLNRMAIWSGDYSNSCFGDSETWFQYRAWHDWIHYRFSCPFTLPGEHMALHIQTGQLIRLYGRGDNVADMVALMFAATLGPLECAEAGKAVTDAHEFCATTWRDWLPYAKHLLSLPITTDPDFRASAEDAYSFRAKFGPPVPPEAMPSSKVAPGFPLPPASLDYPPSMTDGVPH